MISLVIGDKYCLLFSCREEVRVGVDVGGYKAVREGTWADSDTERALKSILAFTKAHNGTQDDCCSLLYKC